MLKYSFKRSPPILNLSPELRHALYIFVWILALRFQRLILNSNWNKECIGFIRALEIKKKKNLIWQKILENLIQKSSYIYFTYIQTFYLFFKQYILKKPIVIIKILDIVVMKYSKNFKFLYIKLGDQIKKYLWCSHKLKMY